MNLPDQQMTEEEYNKLPGIRSTWIKYFMEYGPRAYYQKYILKEFGEEKETDTLRFGKIVHEVLIEGKRNWRTWTGKVRNGHVWEGFKAECEQDGVMIMLPKEAKKLELMIKSVQNNPEAMDLLSQTVLREQAIQFEYGGMQCKTKLDLWLNNSGIVDAKSSLDPTEEGFFYKGIEKFKYRHQACFYELGAQCYLETDAPLDFRFIAIENKEPFRCAVHKMNDIVREASRAQLFEKMNELARCYETDEWREPLAQDEEGNPIVHEWVPSLYWMEKNGMGEY